MNIIIACEESQIITAAFRNRGHNAYSCDLKPCSGGHPEWHFEGDCMPLLHSISKIRWDMAIAHPPCTFLTSSNTYINRGCSKYTAEEAARYREEAIEFFLFFTRLKVPFCIENPVGIMSRLYRTPDQYIHPHQFGDDASKKTCLWLNGLPPLVPTKKIKGRIVNGLPRWANQTDSGQNRLGPSENRSELRSKTYHGIAAAMAEQWG